MNALLIQPTALRSIKIQIICKHLWSKLELKHNKLPICAEFVHCSLMIWHWISEQLVNFPLAPACRSIAILFLMSYKEKKEWSFCNNYTTLSMVAKIWFQIEHQLYKLGFLLPTEINVRKVFGCRQMSVVIVNCFSVLGESLWSNGRR